MKHLNDYTENDETHIEVTSEFRLNQKERRAFVKLNDNQCGSELWVQLPFGGMVVTDIAEFMETGIVTISHWTDKDCWYEGDEDELRVLENMLLDDILGLKRLVGFESKAKPEPVAFVW